jgi:hypothetical protein
MHAFGTLVGGYLFQFFVPASPFYLFTAVELIAPLLLTGFTEELHQKERRSKSISSQPVLYKP